MTDADVETGERLARSRNLKRTAVFIAASILLVVILALLGPKLGPALPPALANTLNGAVKLLVIIIAVAMVWLVYLLIGRAVFFRLMFGGFVIFFFYYILNPYYFESYERSDPFFDNSVPHFPVVEGILSSSPHRTAIEKDCAESGLKRRTQRNFHQHAGLLSPRAYEGKFVEWVSAMLPDESRARVTVTFRGSRDRKTWPLPVLWTKAGDTLVWEGVCTPKGVTWQFHSSLPHRFQSRKDSFQWWLLPL